MNSKLGFALYWIIGLLFGYIPTLFSPNKVLAVAIGLGIYFVVGMMLLNYSDGLDEDGKKVMNISNFVFQIYDSKNDVTYNEVYSTEVIDQLDEEYFEEVKNNGLELVDIYPAEVYPTYEESDYVNQIKERFNK